MSKSFVEKLDSAKEEIVLVALYIGQLEEAATNILVNISKAGGVSGVNPLFNILEKQGLVHIDNRYVVKGPKPADKTYGNDRRGRINKVIMSALGVHESKIHPESSFVKDFWADSLDTIELIMALESEFNVEIQDEDGLCFETVQGVYDYFEEKIND